MGVEDPSSFFFFKSSVKVPVEGLGDNSRRRSLMSSNGAALDLVLSRVCPLALFLSALIAA